MSKVILKSKEEADKMRVAGQKLADVFLMLNDLVKPGLSTMAINDQVEQYIRDQLNARPASKGQYDYPYALNASPNAVICHGMPSEKFILSDSDIINLDITLEFDGFIADSSKMFVMTQAPLAAQQLVAATNEALWRAIAQVKPGNRMGDIGYAIQSFAESRGYSVVRDYCGHGIGREMHESPEVLHYGNKDTGLKLKPGMTFTIEPMINQGTYRGKTLNDGWTVVTQDRKLSAQAEHTLLVTENGVEILTLRAEEQHLPALYLR
ncbi:type I methionyl aminopeptidase [Pseudoalteromonas fenneropenaei]|uniref:Methionine aminopeptidase n=1 Tax=Pseudoalteromonas fenneropenaei TaxID=1737459 RepID=A0ABV7CFP5_9GAMM